MQAVVSSASPSFHAVKPCCEDVCHRVGHYRCMHGATCTCATLRLGSGRAAALESAQPYLKVWLWQSAVVALGAGHSRGRDVHALMESNDNSG